MNAPLQLPRHCKPSVHSLIAICVLFLSLSVRAGNTWDGGGPTDNWNEPNNWNPDGTPAYGTATFSGSTRTSPVLNVNYNMNQLNWTVTSSAWTLGSSGGSVLSLFDNGGTQAKVENNATGLVTINAPITFAASVGNPFGEINAVTADLSFGTGTLTINGSVVAGIKLFGGSHIVTFNNTVSAAGKWFGITTGGTGNTINIGGSFASSDFYVMNDGTLNLNSGGSLTTSVRLGGDFGNTGNQNQTKSGTFNLTVAAGGQTFSGVINSVSGNTSGTLAVNSQNTSGANTLSGHIALDAALKITQAGGGTLNITQVKGGDNTTATDIKGNTLTLVPAAGGTISHSGTIYNSTGAGGVTLAGAGTLSYAAAHTYNGDTLVNQGTLQINSGGSANNSIIRIGDTAANSPAATLSVGSGASFSSTLVVRPSASGSQGVRTLAGSDSSGTATIAGNIFLDANARVTNASGGTLAFTGSTLDLKNQTLTVTNTGTVTTSSSTVLQNSTGSGKLLKQGPGAFTLSAANTYTGGTTIEDGTLNINSTTAIGTGTLTFGGSATIDNTSGSSKTLANNNALTLSGGSLTFGGTFDLNFGSGTVTISGANRTFTVSAGTLTLGGTINESGSRSLTKLGAGTLVLNGAGNYSGGMTIGAALTSGGTLQIGDDTSLGSGTFNLNTGTIQSSGGTRSIANVTVLGGNATVAGSANFNFNGASFTQSGNNRILTINNGGATTISGSFYLSETSGSGRKLTKAGPGALTISGPIADFNGAGTAGSITNTGGTLTLSGANTYSGTTTVSGGTLLVNNTSGSGTGSGSVLIQNGATLGGTGSISGVLTIQSGGTLAPGTSIGTLTLNVPPALQGATQMEIDKNSIPSSDRVVISSGTLNYGGILTVINNGATLTGGETFTLFSAGGYSGSFASINPPTLGPGLNWWTGDLISNGTISVNRAPTAGNTNFSRGPGMSLKIHKPTLLTANTSDADGNSLTLQSLGASGQGATITSDSTYIYYTPANDNNDSFSYSISDGRGGSASATINVQVVRQGGIAQTISFDNNGVTVTFAGIPDFQYDVQRSATSDFATYDTVLTTNAPSGGVFVYTDSSPLSPSGYYRLMQH